MSFWNKLFASTQQGSPQPPGLPSPNNAASNDKKVADEMRILVTAALGDKSLGARLQAEQTLAQAGAPAVEALINVLEDAYGGVGRGAMWVLGRMGSAAVEPLIRALGDKKPANYLVPMRAAQLLGKIGDARAIGPLERAIRFGVNVDQAAAIALGELGEYDVLVRTLENKDDEVAEKAIIALNNMGDTRAADAIYKRSAGTRNAGILLFSGIALVNFNDTRAIEPLMELYRIGYRDSASHAYCDMVIEHLTQLPPAKTVTALIEVLQDSLKGRGKELMKYQCLLTAAALGNSNDQRAVPPLIQAANSNNSEVQACALRSLGQLNAIDPLVKALRHKNSEVRAAAAWGLAISNNALGVETLLQDLRRDNESFHAAKALVDLGNTQGFDALSKHVERKDKHYQDAAAILARVRDKRGIDVLIEQIRACHDSEKIQYAGILGASGDERSIEVLRDLGGRHYTVHLAAISALGNLGNPLATPKLIEHLDDFREKYRLEAVIALGRIGDIRAVDPLIVLLDDINLGVQSAAARVLGMLGDMRALNPLIRTLGERRKRVRVAAVDALGQLGNHEAIAPLLKLREADPLLRDPIDAAIVKLNLVKEKTLESVPVPSRELSASQHEERAITADGKPKTAGATPTIAASLTAAKVPTPSTASSAGFRCQMCEEYFPGPAPDGWFHCPACGAKSPGVSPTTSPMNQTQASSPGGHE
jgi:HEAT repeat protein